MSLPLPAPAGAEHDVRVAGLRAWMAEVGAHAFVAVSPENVYYLTGLDHLGYFAFTAVLIPAGGTAPVVVTREMERPTVRAQLPGHRHVTFPDGDDPAAAVAGALAGLVPPGGLIAVEEEAMFFPPSIRAGLDRALAERRWVDGTGVLATVRAVKTPLEIGDIRRAAAVSDAAMAAGIGAARPGAPERDVAAAVHHAMFAAGGQPPGFTPLIRPLWMLEQEHVSWGDRTVADGVFLELSGCVRRYHAPMSRTVYTGPVPAGAVQAHAAATAGLDATLDALRPGTTTGEVYAAWRRAVAGTSAATWPSRHHCGYLVGIGFPPSWVGGGQVLGIRAGGEVEITAGMTFHLMSWVTEPTGHVVSDTALVTPTGAELLTTTTRELIAVS
ncbi:MAG: M24 family metallopeptidase [Actinophytocola sp.]|uniref:M24 family metallopeptidase n=1 Tax=Actinophytocola sp. TaxID=1872138 RepID=UPI0013206FD4|nr:Xaa-Pro peptidase family protein [Actinophytocola sp.]MPZ84844.1 M24 family metallopeptidase [Actinophytocola sp.]